MIHYLYSTRGGYLYMVGRYTTQPRVETDNDFVVSVSDKTSQVSVDSLAHKRFMEHLRRPRRVSHERHRNNTIETKLLAGV